MEDETCTGELQRQIVMFELADENYCIGLEYVQEVIRSTNITRVPQSADFVEGVLNLRGYVIPVVDLRKRFGLQDIEKSGTTRILIVEIEDQVVGIQVDKVLEVAEISEQDIELPSQLLRSAVKTDYLKGFIEIKNELVKILNFEKVFSTDELKKLSGIEDNENPEG